MATRYRSRFSWVKRCGRATATVALGMGVAGLGLGCGGQRTETACAPDPERASRIAELLEGRAEARELGAAGAASSICFADGPGTLHPGSVLVLPRDVADPEAAARLAHLLHHRRFGRGLVAFEPVDPDDCPAAVEEALREEAAAHVLEIELRAALGVETPRYPLGNYADILRLARTERGEAMLEHLRSHPEGGEGYPPLARDYAERCRRE